MTLRWLFAVLHLLGLAIGVGSVWARGRALSGPLDRAGLRRVFEADTWWGISAIVLIGTGLTRLLADFEKSTAYYMQHNMFYAKMAFLLVILVIESRAAITLGRWRRVVASGGEPDTSAARSLARISFIEVTLLVLMVFAATAMARGFWA